MLLQIQSTLLSIFLISSYNYFCSATTSNTDPELSDKNPPTIKCFDYTVGCYPVYGAINIASVITYIDPLGGTEMVKTFTQNVGCWCQNNGQGPPSPTWLTCPNSSLGIPVLLAYDLQDIVRMTNCHCNCP